MATTSTYNKEATAMRTLSRSAQLIDAPVLTALPPLPVDPQTLIKTNGINPVLVDGQVKTPVSGQGQGIFNQIIDLGKVFLEKNPGIVGTAQSVTAYNVGATPGRTIQYTNTGDQVQQPGMRDDVKILLIVGGAIVAGKLLKLF